MYITQTWPWWLIPLALFLLPFGVAAWEKRALDEPGVGVVAAVVATVSWMVALAIVVMELLHRGPFFKASLGGGAQGVLWKS